MNGLELKRNGTPTKAGHARLLELAGVYRNLSRRELARALGRDSSKLMSANGNPKLDYVVRLARLLDWSIGDVAEAIFSEADNDDGIVDNLTFDELDVQARTAHRQGEFAGMGRIARRMAQIADTADRRATAALREAGAWDGLGRHTNQLEAVRRGLHYSPTSTDLKALLQANLANTYYSLSHLVEARAMARELIEALRADPPASRSSRAAHAFSHYVFGNSCRRLMDQERDRGPRHAQAAHEALQTAAEMYAALAEQYDHDPWRGIAHTCRGGMIEVEVELGRRSHGSAIELMAAETDAVDPRQTSLAGDRLESIGWWCVFGAGISLRHLAGAELQRSVASFTDKGYGIADTLGNWAMREQLFTMQLIQRQRLNDLAGVPVEWTINDEELRQLIGTMGRFPSFRRTGWQILETATVVRST